MLRILSVVLLFGMTASVFCISLVEAQPPPSTPLCLHCKNCKDNKIRIRSELVEFYPPSKSPRWGTSFKLVGGKYIYKVEFIQAVLPDDFPCETGKPLQYWQVIWRCGENPEEAPPSWKKIKEALEFRDTSGAWKPQTFIMEFNANTNFSVDNGAFTCGKDLVNVTVINHCCDKP